MLLLSKVGRRQLGYYLDPAAADLDGGDGSGTFLGRLADALDLVGVPADRETLPPLLDGIDPRTGEILDPQHSRVRVLAYDCTFAAPKSVSLLASLMPPSCSHDVVAAHETSVFAALSYIEHVGALVRRQESVERVESSASGVASASFLHRTSRANDPHLHNHILVANLGVDAKGRYSALDGRGLYGHLATVGALYRCHLRYELTRRLGVSWQPPRVGFSDVEGLSRRVIEAFSIRSEEIAEEVERLGRDGSAARVLAAHSTRHDKDRATTLDELEAMWKERGLRLGIGPAGIQRLLGLHRDDAPASAARDPSVTATVALEAFPGAFSRDTLLRATSDTLRSGAPVAEVERAVDAVLGGPTVVQVAASGLRRGRRSEIPPARLEANFLSQRAAGARAANEGAIASAAPFGQPTESDSSVVRICRPDELVALGALAAIYRRSGAPIHGLATSVTAAAHLEAITAVPTAAAADRAERLQAGTRVVVFAPTRMPPLTFEAIRHEAGASRSTLVVVEESALRTPPLSHTWEVERTPEIVGRVGIVRVECPSSVAAEFQSKCRSLEQAGHEVIAVSAGAWRFDVPTIPPHLVADELRRRPGSMLVVLGSARLLGGALTRLAATPRLHVVVAPRLSDPGLDRASTLEIAEPQALVAALGRVPRGVEARARWRERARERSIVDSSSMREPAERGRIVEREVIQRRHVGRELSR